MANQPMVFKRPVVAAVIVIAVVVAVVVVVTNKLDLNLLLAI